MQQSRLAVAFLALAAIGACKNESQTKPAPGTATATATGSGTGTGTGTAPATAVVVADAAPAPVADGPITRPFFFVAEKDGKQVHLLGTFHIGVDPTRLPAVVWDAFRASKTLAVETNILDPALLSVAQRTDGKTLEDELGPEYWKKLSDLIGANLVDGMKGMTAAAASTVVQVKYLPQTQPMDLAFVFEAKKTGKELRYLEEAQLQATLFDRWMDVRVLKATLDDADQLKAKTHELLAAYVGGDGDTMVALSLDKEGWSKTGRSAAEFDQMQEEMLYGRNRSWIPAIEAMAAEGGGFVAVGAAHLVGKGSVVELLEAQGYKVTRIGQ
jgi:uncharacterized protein YbaP (TraB family)